MNFMNLQELDRASKKNAQDYPQGIPACGSDALRFGLLAHCGQVRNLAEISPRSARPLRPGS